MTKYVIKLVLGNKVIQTVTCDAVCQSKAEDLAFAYADLILGTDQAKEVELFFIDNPRHQVLFNGVN